MANEPQHKNKLLSRHEACGELGIKIDNIAKLIGDGELKIVRIGRKIMIRRGALDEFIEAREGYAERRVINR